MPKNIDVVKSFNAEDMAAVLSRYCASRERCTEDCIFYENCPDSCIPQDWEKWLDEEHPFPWAVN